MSVFGLVNIYTSISIKHKMKIYCTIIFQVNKKIVK